MNIVEFLTNVSIFTLSNFRFFGPSDLKDLQGCEARSDGDDDPERVDGSNLGSWSLQDKITPFLDK